MLFRHGETRECLGSQQHIKDRGEEKKILKVVNGIGEET